jgi:hypothetical protein
MSAKVIQISRSGFHDFLDDVRADYDAGKVTDMICMYRRQTGPDPRGRMQHEWSRQWWGETSTITSIGLLEVMKHEMLKHCTEDD